ncbi:MAG: CobW family GTP-binding protein, partial [Microcystaceae cyanobacterium]
IVTLVDCENFSLDLFNSQAAQSQISYGDIIVLNKTDLVDEADVDALEVRIRDMKESARIIRTQKSQVPLPLILSVGLFESDKYFDPTAEVEEAGDHHHHDHEKAHDHDQECTSECTHEEHGHSHHNHVHDHHSNHLEMDGFTSLSFESDQPFAIRKFQYFLDNQLSANVFRAKGIIWFSESPKRHIFHLSGKRFSLEDDEWKGNPKNQLVFIGQNLDHAKIREQVEACLSLPATNRGKGFG